jgi:undecaprenyl diphosphate synthase
VVNKLRHVAIIMDGNGRWAQDRGQPRTDGHRAGARVAKNIIEEAYKQGIKQLTLFAFGQDNWSRPADEIGALISLMSDAIEDATKSIDDRQIRFSIIGNMSAFPSSLQEQLSALQRLTQDHQRMRVVLALNYSGRWDVLQACQKLLNEFQVSAEKTTLSEITEAHLAKHLSTSLMSDPDIMIRTSGEVRISNFMLWQLAYTELFFIDKPWPSFTTADFNAVLAQYRSRQRRYGGITAKQHDFQEAS